jgi:hypothetical protein
LRASAERQLSKDSAFSAARTRPFMPGYGS